MRTTFLTVAVVLFSLNSFAQEQKNIQKEERTVVRTIKDSDGEQKIVKREVIKEVQPVQVDMSAGDNHPINIPMATDTPVQVTKTTSVSVDGTTKSVDVNKSAYYVSNGVTYKIDATQQGFTIAEPKKKNTAILRKTSNNNYIYVNKNRVSLAYFDADGNLILETYNQKTDSVVREKYDVVK